MNKILMFLSVFLFLGCASSEQLEIVEKQQNYKIILNNEPSRPKLKYYDTIWIEDYNIGWIEVSDLICFDEKNVDIFNSNYYQLLNYMKQLENDNKYLREQIKINNSK